MMLGITVINSYEEIREEVFSTLNLPQEDGGFLLLSPP